MKWLYVFTYLRVRMGLTVNGYLVKKVVVN